MVSAKIEAVHDTMKTHRKNTHTFWEKGKSKSRPGIHQEKKVGGDDRNIKESQMSTRSLMG